MDKEKIEAGVKLILEGIGEKPDREGLIDTLTALPECMKRYLVD